jgi:hypothetical protein
MGIFGIAKRGFGMLKKKKKSKLSSDVMSKVKQIDKDFKKASERALKFSKKLEK